MATHLVSYDLKKPGQNYAGLIKALSNVGARILKSAWIIDVNQTAAEARNDILTHLDRNDDLIVIEIRAASYDWATFLDTTNPGLALLKLMRP